MLEMYFSFVRVELYVTVLIATDFYLGAGGAEYGRRMSHLAGYVYEYACMYTYRRYWVNNENNAFVFETGIENEKRDCA